MIKLQVSEVIDGKVVTKAGQIGNSLSVYKTAEDSDDETLYVVDKKGILITKIHIEADMSQGGGYISNIVFTQH